MTSGPWSREWPTVELGEVASSRLGKMLSPASKTGGDESPYLGNADVRWGHLELSDLRTMTFTPHEQREFALRRGDVLICEGGEVGRTAVLDRHLPGVYFQKAIHRVRCSERLDPRFLFHFMRFAAARDGFRDFTSHATIAHLTGVKLRRIPLPLPPIDEQRRIAAVLDSADGLRAARRRSLEGLGALTHAIFVEMFAEPRGSRVELSEVAEVQGGLQVTSKRKDYPIEVPYLRVANVHRGLLDLAEMKILRVTQTELARARLSVGDLLIVEGHGNKEEIGRVGMWDGSVDPCVHQNHLIRVRCNESRVLPRYAEAYLNSHTGRRTLLRAANTTSGLNTISTGDVRSVQLPLPPLSDQRRFVAEAEVVDERTAEMQRSEQQLDTLFAALQQRAFRGEL